jgi:hypothetical protein
MQMFNTDNIQSLRERGGGPLLCSVRAPTPKGQSFVKEEMLLPSSNWGGGTGRKEIAKAYFRKIGKKVKVGNRVAGKKNKDR